MKNIKNNLWHKNEVKNLNIIAPKKISTGDKCIYLDSEKNRYKSPDISITYTAIAISGELK